MAISILIKSLNEENHIERCINSCKLCGVKAKVFLADSLSQDATICIAKKFPINIIQLKSIKDRSCGVGAQLGWQYVDADFILILDGDMELLPGFINAAVSELEKDSKLAGVGGQVIEMVDNNFEFKRRKILGYLIGDVDFLSGGGIYRSSAIKDIAYLTNRNLHSFEETELGWRLQAKGWKLKRINVPAIKHYGHTDESYALLLKRWRSKYLWGYGELMRASVRKPYFLKSLWNARLGFLIMAVWVFFILSLFFNPIIGIMPIISLFLIQIVRKRSIAHGIYSVISWHFVAAAIFPGFFRKQKNPKAWIPSKIIKEAKNA